MAATLEDLAALSEDMVKLFELDKERHVFFDGRKYTWHSNYGLMYVFLSDGGIAYGFEKPLGGIYLHGKVRSAKMFKRKLRAYMVRAQVVNKAVWKTAQHTLKIAESNYMDHQYALNRIDAEIN